MKECYMNCKNCKYAAVDPDRPIKFEKFLERMETCTKYSIIECVHCIHPFTNFWKWLGHDSGRELKGYTVIRELDDKCSDFELKEKEGD